MAFDNNTPLGNEKIRLTDEKILANFVALGTCLNLSGGVIRTFPATTPMIFYLDTAPTLWTIDNTLDDKLLFVTKGNAAGGETGGGAHSAGTWTQPNHTHTGPSHTHAFTGGGHTHTGPSHTHTGPSHTHSASSLFARFIGTGSNDYYNVALSAFTPTHKRLHSNVTTGNTAAQTSAVTIGGTLGSGGTGATGASGTGASGSTAASGTVDAGGTGATGGGATANTWRPDCECVIICTKD